MALEVRAENSAQNMKAGRLNYAFLIRVYVLIFSACMFLPITVMDMKVGDLGVVFSVCIAFVLLIVGKLPYKLLSNLKYFAPFLLYILFHGLFFNVPLLNIASEFIQWISVITFISLILISNEGRSRKFLRQLAVLLFLGSLVVVALHVMDGRYLGYKQFSQAKYLFGLSSLLWYYLARVDRKALTWCVFLVAAAVSIMSLERKGVVGLGVVILFDFGWALMGRLGLLRYKGVYALLIAAMALLAAAYVYQETDSAWSDYENENEALWISEIHRRMLLSNGVDIFLANPHGVGAKMLPTYMQSFFIEDELVVYTHNFYLDSLVEYGIAGAFILLVTYLKLISKSKIYMPNFKLMLAAYASVVMFFVAVNTAVLFIWLLAAYFPDDESEYEIFNG